MMGLAQAKVSGASDDVIGKILWLYMFNDNPIVRKLAKSAFLKLAPKDAKQVVKANWKDKYRTQSFSKIFSDTSIKDFKNCKVGDCDALIRGRYPALEKKFGHVSVIENRNFILGAFIHPVTLLISHDLTPTSISITGPLCKGLKHDNFIVRLVTTKALGMIGDVQAVEPLIKLLKDDDSGPKGVREYWGTFDVSRSALKALGKIGDTRALEPLIKVLEEGNEWNRPAAAKALGKIGDKRAVKPLVKILNNQIFDVHQATLKALSRLGHPEYKPKDQDREC